jgi:DNA-binding winged helix-turn-helix (wHTH) protein/tetratricopeptide (TPR) repeat protein
LNAAPQFRFGRFVLNRERGCLQDTGGAELFLRPKSFLLLTVLVERAGTLVSKDDLARLVWPDVIVSDDSVAHCVSDIRKALGAEGAGHIRTMQRRGYMFVPEIDAGTARGKPAVRTALSGPPRRAAVGAVAAALVGIGAVWLVTDGPRGPSAVSTARTGAEAGEQRSDAADAALRRANNLLDDRDWTRRSDNELARSLLEKVVAANPDNADAWASLGLTYWLEVQHLTWAGGRREMRQALEMLERSVLLGASARAHRLLAEMRLLAPFEEMRSPPDALAAARAAVQLDPEDPDSLAVLAEVLSLTGRAAEAVEVIERARRLNPNYPSWYDRVAGVSYLFAGEPNRAAEEFRQVYDEGQLTHARSWSGWLLAASLAHSGRKTEAAEIVAAALRRRPEANLDMVATTLDGIDRREDMNLVLEGLRLAGVPG